MGKSQLTSLDPWVFQGLPTVCQEPGTGPYPVSYAQESLWFMEQMAPGRATYNLPEAWRLQGHLDLTALQRSLDEVVRRQEILRTNISVRDGKPEQAVLSSARIELRIVEVPSAENPESELQRRLQAEARRPFTLGCAPLARAVLFRRDAQEHVLLLNLHHIISDAWSQRVFMRELARCYAAFVMGEAGSLPALPVQYADFSLWQRALVQSEAGRADLAYWQEKLRKPFKPLLLRTDHPRRAIRACNGATQFCDLPGPLVEALRDLSRKHGVTLFMTLLAAFTTLLHRYTQEEDVVVGSPMAGRERVEIEGLIGLFVNTHALRSDLSGDPTFVELLGRIREVVLEASAHQEVPCELVMQTFQGERARVGHPLFPVVFGWQGATPESLALPGLQATLMEVDTGTAKFDWTVLVTESQGRLSLRSEFSTELFEDESMARLMHQFQVLLQSVVAAPNSRISELPLLTRDERDHLLVKWNQTKTEYERDCCIHQLFEAQVERSPEAIALVFGGRTVNYADLNGRANQLARRLVAEGVAPGIKVGLCLERSFEMITGILGILKAGGAYVPLDRSYPSERLAFMTEDCGVSVLVTDSGWFSNQKLCSTIKKVICLDAQQDPLAGEDQANLPSTANPWSLAYVMYTSGSTGTPKGVLVPHQAVVRLVRNTNYLEFSNEQVFLQLAPITFDASTFEIWGALLNGARLVIFPAHVPSLEELGRTIRDSQITTLWLTSGLFHQMVDHQLENMRGLKHLLAGGDVLSPAHVARTSRELSGCQVINGYGPTENTTFTCCYRLPEVWPDDRSVPIGRPIANTRVYVLDKHMAPVPVGVPGELYAGGDGLAQGYLNQPELTAEKFVPNPFATDSRLRLYRTGDIARWLPDGNLEFLSRNDGQVKVRGYRVEPGEIENALIEHPAVEEAVIVARLDKSGTKQLVAYVVVRPGHQPVEAELREFLGRKMPSYMVPSHIIRLGALPLTVNGKIDRGALPEPEQASAQNSPDGQVQARTPTEAMVCSIWREVLGRDRVGIHEDFFELGGHSLLATQVISRISKLGKVELPVVAIFEARTVSRLAGEIERAQREHPPAERQVISRASTARAAELLEHLDEFSEAELDEILRDPELKSLL
jgi:amino acid adenylation domain-containing protein